MVKLNLDMIGFIGAYSYNAVLLNNYYSRHLYRAVVRDWYADITDIK